MYGGRGWLRFGMLLAWLGAAPSVVGGQCPHDPDGDGPRVTVSARVAEIVFPCDSPFVWGGPRPRDRAVERDFDWAVFVTEAVVSPGMVQMRVRDPDVTSDRLPSLDTLVRLGNAGSFGTDTMLRMHASVTHNRLVFTTHDSATITRLFGLLPDAVMMVGPGPRYAPFLSVRARISYVAPRVPPPTAALRAIAAESKRRDEASRTWYARDLEGAEWLEAGDSATFSYDASTCSFDVCGGPAADSVVAWSTSDSTVLRVVPRASDLHAYLSRMGITSVAGPKDAVVHALARGTATVMVRFKPADASGVRVGRRAVVVVDPIARIRVLADTIALSPDSLVVRVVAFDETGRALGPVPASFDVTGDEIPGMGGAAPGYGGGPATIRFQRSGRHCIVARLRKHGDTLCVLVPPPVQRVIPLYLDLRRLRVRVVAERTAEPLDGAEVRVTESSQSVVTDTSGIATLDVVPVGPIHLVIARPGYETRTIDLVMSEKNGLYVEAAIAPTPRRVRDRSQTKFTRSAIVVPDVPNGGRRGVPRAPGSRSLPHRPLDVGRPAPPCLRLSASSYVVAARGA